MGVEHSGGSFDDPLRWMPLALGEKQALDRNAAQQRQVDDVRILDAIAETSAGRDNEIREPEGSDLDGEVCHAIVLA